MNHQTLRDQVAGLDHGENDGYPTPPRGPLVYTHKHSLSPDHVDSLNQVSSLNSSDYALSKESHDRFDLSGKIVHDFMMLFDQANDCFSAKETRFVTNEQSSIVPSERMKKGPNYVCEDVYDNSVGGPLCETTCDDQFDAIGSFNDQRILRKEKIVPNVSAHNSQLTADNTDTLEPSNNIQQEEIRYFGSESYPEQDEFNEHGDSRPKMKKPFLRKGTRKEPSALHRVGSVRDECTSTGITGETVQLEKLQELEKMQRDQIEQLEHRISRRAEARKAIIKQKQRDSSDSINNVKTVDKSHSIPKPANIVEASAKQKKNSHKVVGVDDEVRSPLNKHKIGSTVNADKDKPQDQMPVQKTDDIAEILSPKKAVDGDDHGHTKDQLEEQWQVIKCMRKRQEAALRDAERDREEARRWAASERETVQRWVDQQKFYLKREKERIANSAMAVERKKKLDVLEEKATAAVEYNHKKAREEIEALKTETQKLKIDSDAFKSRARLSDKRLRDIISDKDNKLHASTDEVASLQERNKDLTAKVEEYSRKITSLKRRLSQSVKNDDGARWNHDSNVDPEESEVPQKTSELKEFNEEVCSSSDQRYESDKWDTHIEFLGNTQMEEVKRSNEMDNDSTALRALSNYPDLIEEPTEFWLQKHLGRLHDQSIRTKTDSNQASKAPIGTVVEEVPTAATPTRSAPKFDQVSPVAVSTKSSSGNAESQSIRTKTDSMQDSKATIETARKEVPDTVTPIRTAPKFDQASPITVSTKSSSENAESQSFLTPSKTTSSRSSHNETCMPPNNRRIVQYQNGTQKEILADGATIIRYTNGDVKTSYANAGIIVYYYASSKTSHTSHPDGMEIYEFSNGQVEKHFTSGRKEIRFPDGTRKTIFPDGNKETIFSDGVKVVEYKDGQKEVIHPFANAS